MLRTFLDFGYLLRNQTMRLAVDGRDYDPSRDYVCDRLEDWTDEFGVASARSRNS